MPTADNTGGILPTPMQRRMHVQRGFLAVILALAALLVLAATSSFLAARRMTDLLLQGEGEHLWHTLREQLPRGRPPTPEELADLLARHRDIGLRHLAVLGPHDESLASAGPSPHTAPPDIRVTRTPDGRARLKRPLRSPPPPRPDAHDDSPRRPRPESASHNSPGGPGLDADDPLRPPRPDAPLDPQNDRLRPPHPDAGPIHLVLEFEPQVAAAVLSRARRDLLVALAVAAGLLVSAAVYWRLQKRSRSIEATLIERRHFAMLGEMSAVLAHEIRNPLASLKGHAQLLEEQLAGDDRRQAKARRIVDEAVRLERLTTSLLDFVRASRVARQLSDPRALARRAADITDASRVKLDDQGAPDVWSLDPTRIEQALVNLVRNALQASDKPVELSVRREDGGLLFQISDRGPGIAPAVQARLFQPFVTGRTQGTGLGLSVVRRVAELHGGTVVHSARTGGGATFRLWLPPGPDPTIAPPSAPAIEHSEETP